MEQLVQKYTRELANLRCKKREVCNRLEKLQRVRDYMKNSIQDNCDNVNSKIRLGADKISNGVIMRDKTLLLEYDIREEAEADKNISAYFAYRSSHSLLLSRRILSTLFAWSCNFLTSIITLQFL